jgi:hypothetical protein
LPYTRRQPDRLIRAFPISKALENAGLPIWSEGAAREVADLPPEKPVEVVQAANEENPNCKLTAEKVRKARQRTTHRKGKLHEEDLQALIGSGNVVMVNGQSYSKGTPEYKAEMERREANKPKGEKNIIRVTGRYKKARYFLVK